MCVCSVMSDWDFSGKNTGKSESESCSVMSDSLWAPIPGHFPDPRIRLIFPGYPTFTGKFFTSAPSRKSYIYIYIYIYIWGGLCWEAIDLHFNWKINESGLANSEVAKRATRVGVKKATPPSPAPGLPFRLLTRASVFELLFPVGSYY